MPDSYKELIKSNPDETENQELPGERRPSLRDTAHPRHPARRCERGGGPPGHELSAFVRTCMIEELAKKGA